MRIAVSTMIWHEQRALIGLLVVVISFKVAWYIITLYVSDDSRGIAVAPEEFRVFILGE